MDYHGLFFWCQIVNIDNLGRFNITVESASFSSLSALLAPKKGFQWHPGIQAKHFVWHNMNILEGCSM